MKIFLIIVAANIVGKLIFYMCFGIIGGIRGSHNDSKEEITESNSQDYAELQEKYMELQKKYMELKNKLDTDLTDESEAVLNGKL